MPTPPPMPGNQPQQSPPSPQQQYAPQQFPAQPFPPQQFPQQQYPPQQYPPQGPGMYPGMQPQPRKSSALKIILAVVGGLVALIILAIVLLVAFSDDPTPPSGPTKTTNQTTTTVVGVPVITDQVNEETQAPLRDLKGVVKPSTNEIFAAFETTLKKGQTISAKWYYNNSHQSQLDTALPVDEDFKGWASFNIGNAGKPWPEGQYKVEIYVDGQKQQEMQFNVKS
jgi:hypothetical protein